MSDRAAPGEPSLPKPDRVLVEKVRNRANAVTWGACAAGRVSESGGTDAIWSSWPWLLGSVCQYRALASSQRLSAMVGVGTRGRYEPLLLTLGQSASEHPCDAEAIKDARAPSRRHKRPDIPA